MNNTNLFYEVASNEVKSLSFLLSYPVFKVLIFLIFVSVPYARFSWPSRQLMSAR